MKYPAIYKRDLEIWMTNVIKNINNAAGISFSWEQEWEYNRDEFYNA